MRSSCFIAVGVESDADGRGEVCDDVGGARVL